MLKVSIKKVLFQKKYFLRILNMPRSIQKMALAVLIFSEGFGSPLVDVNYLVFPEMLTDEKFLSFTARLATFCVCSV